jgi:hypothetical protein
MWSIQTLQTKAILSKLKWVSGAEWPKRRLHAIFSPELQLARLCWTMQVMKRRTELRRAQNAAIAEVEERERAARAEQEFKDSAKTTLGPRLSEWSQESSGRKVRRWFITDTRALWRSHPIVLISLRLAVQKDIRALLATMHTVLWEGASWEPASMSKLLIPAKVRFFYLKAVRIVHPDKHNTMDAAQRFAAEAIFHALETAYRVFEESEMAGGAGASGAASPNNVISSL